MTTDDSTTTPPVPKNGVKAILLAGGLGTRLRPLTDTLPKCLVPIAGRPLLDYWVDALAAADGGGVDCGEAPLAGSEE